MKKKTETEQMPLAGGEEAEILARLSERVEKAIAAIQDLRKERDALRARLEQAEARLREHSPEDCDRFRKERGEIRNRIESILANLESLDEG